MKRILLSAFCLASTWMSSLVHAQDLHFSQYYNAPMLLNPANTGLLQDKDWRAGLQYRNQGGTIPVPYNTFSAFADFGLLRNKWETSWLGAGLAVWRDVAGNGNLALTKIQGNLAYHVLLNDKSSLSLGMGISNNQRSVDFSKLTYDVQWDEFSFNSSIDNQEDFTRQKTSFMDLHAGINYSFYNNTNFYLKASMAAQHINQPVETFYGASVKRGIRPIGHIEASYKANDRLIINPSLYYTTAKKASELVLGSLLHINTTGATELESNNVILGGFLRNKDAIILAAGYDYRSSRIMFSYDHTISTLSKGNQGFGAFEISVILQGGYSHSEPLRKTYGCPRF